MFPGGRVESTDRHGPDAGAELGAARRAAIRETAEETALALDPDALVWFAHWTPPPIAAGTIAAARLVVVHAIDDNAAELYQHHSFLPSPDDAHHLVQKLSDIAKSLDLG